MTNKTSIKDYSERMEVVQDNFPELYRLYRNGAIIIYDVYTFEENGKEKYGISYRYR